MRRAALGLLAALLAAAGLPAVAQEQPAGPGEADRVVVRYTQGAYELVSVTPLETHLAPSDELPEGEHSGFWFEVVSSGGELVYRRVIGHPVPLVFEGPDTDEPEPQSFRPMVETDFTPGRESGVRTERRKLDEFVRPEYLHRDRQTGEPQSPRPLTISAEDPDRVGGVPAERLFALLIPRAQVGDELVLFSSPLDPQAPADAATEVARLPLVEDEGGES
jgi:hypothetical protein